MRRCAETVLTVLAITLLSLVLSRMAGCHLLVGVQANWGF